MMRKIDESLEINVIYIFKFFVDLLCVLRMFSDFTDYSN